MAEGEGEGNNWRAGRTPASGLGAGANGEEEELGELGEVVANIVARLRSENKTALAPSAAAPRAIGEEGIVDIRSSNPLPNVV